MKLRNIRPNASTLLLVTGVLLAVSAPSVAVGDWIAVGDDANASAPQGAQVMVGRADHAGLDVTIELSGVALSRQETPSGEFVLVKCPDARLGGETGAPALPVVRRLFIAPPGAAVTLLVNEGRASTIDLPAAGFAAPVIPMQPQVPIAPDGSVRAPFHYVADCYARDADAPTERVTVTELGIMRGRHLYLLEVWPVAYNPTCARLTVWPRLDVEIAFAGGDAGEGGWLPPLNGVLLNPPAPVELRGGAGNYLIIVPSDFAGSAPITQFANNKTAQGFNVMTHTVSAGTSAATIKTYIQSLWGGPDAPDYVLLAADTAGTTSTSDTLPYFVGGGTKAAVTDLPYGCMDGSGDWYPDMGIGRFPASDLTELQTMVDKTILVSGGVFSDPAYVRHAGFIAGTDPDCGDEEAHDWVIENHLDPRDFTSDRLYWSLGKGTEDIYDSFNAGCLYAVYFGHSSFNHWWDLSFHVDDVHNLVNDGLYSFVFSFTCSTGSYWEDGECMGEAWLRVVNSGGAAYIGSTALIYAPSGPWTETIALEEYAFASIYDDELRQIGLAWQGAIVRLIAEFGASSPVCRDYSECFNLLGDPALAIPEPAGFAIESDPPVQAICTPPDTEAVYTVQVEPLYGFSEAVTLSTGGLPGGAQASFSVNNAVPPFTSILTITNTPPGDYDVAISGNGGGILRFTYVDLIVSTDPPGLVTLSEPPSGQTGVSLTPTLVWGEATEAAQYYLEIATDPGFSEVAYSVTTTETSHTVADPLDELTIYFWHVRAINGCGEGDYFSMFVFTTYEYPEYFTEQFLGEPFDLDWHTAEFVPDGSGYFYEMCAGPAAGLPTDPAGGTALSPGNDGYVRIYPSTPVLLYGQSYSSIYVNGNGNLTFTGYDSTYNESLFFHFLIPRVAGVYDDLTPNTGGSVSWKETADRVAVTFQNIEGYGFDDTVTFQVEMFFDGEVHITWLDVDSESCIVGLSGGGGTPEDYIETDFSNADSCGPACHGDLDDDGDRDIADLAQLLGHYGDTGVTYWEGDLDEDGDVDIADLAELLGVYGDPCPP